MRTKGSLNLPERGRRADSKEKEEPSFPLRRKEEKRRSITSLATVEKKGRRRINGPLLYAVKGGKASSLRPAERENT